MATHILYRILALFAIYAVVSAWIFFRDKSSQTPNPNPGLGGYDGGNSGIIIAYIYAGIFVLICWILYVLYEAYSFHTTGNFDLRNVNLLMAASVMVISYFGLKITVGI